MAGARIKVIRNRCPEVAVRFPRETSTIVRTQTMESEAHVKTNVVKYDVIDTGNLLGSVKGEMTGEFSGLVSVSAESADGYPYPAAQNFGTVYIAPRPFFSDELHRAETAFPEKFKTLEGRL